MLLADISSVLSQETKCENLKNEMGERRGAEGNCNEFGNAAPVSKVGQLGLKLQRFLWQNFWLYCR